MDKIPDDAKKFMEYMCACGNELRPLTQAEKDASPPTDIVGLRDSMMICEKCNTYSVLLVKKI